MTTPESGPNEYILQLVGEYVDARERLMRGGYPDRIHAKRVDLLSDLAGKQHDPILPDQTTQTWVSWIDSIEQSTPPDQLWERLANELSYYAKTAPAMYERQERNQSIKAEIESHREGFDKDRDGLPGGRYEEVGGEFKRIGDAEPLETYHGTVVPEGEIIQEFRPSYGNPDSDNRPSIGNTPAVYSTPDAEAALEYAMGYNNAFVGEDAQGQLYKLNIKPDEIVDLGHCQDDASARLAIKKGFDVIECPDFWEQPETITFDPKKIEVDAVYPVTDAQDADDYNPDVVIEGDRQIDELKSQGFIGDPIYRREDGRMDNVRDIRMDNVRSAVSAYQEANPPTSIRLGTPKGILEKFPGMFGRTSTPKSSGRGRLY